MTSLVAYGTYVPHYRLRRSAIGDLLGTAAGGGTRAVASYDEDSTTLGTAAALAALEGCPDALPHVRSLLFATATPPYADKTNAAAVHAALGLPAQALAVDMAGAVRSGAGALHLAARADEDTLVVLSDVRTGAPGSPDERAGGDAAAAFLFGDGSRRPALAEVLARASVTHEVMDRWRAPGASAASASEERFTEQIHVPAAEAAFDEALRQAGLEGGDIDHVAVAGLHQRALKSVAARLGVRTGRAPAKSAGVLAGTVGNPGTAQPGLLLADALDRARPGERIALVVLGDGAWVLLLEAGEGLAAGRPAVPVADRAAAGDDTLSYGDYLTWRGFLFRQPQARPVPAAPAAPPAWRQVDWKFGLVAGRCTDCGTRALPPARLCSGCRSVDRMAEERLAGVQATVVTHTVDHLAHSPHPPLILAVVEFDGGGRFRCELTDARAEEVRSGMRVAMTFRRMLTSDGVHNYFWKARPVR
ncbi:OB-fold domain-containing protein [Streptomyces sp. NPDC044571]|uniref:OB-fold domain-containing protein n=1 Tax=Streptomyces sp. NPDC044571 TaxID=3155371 RepID=UPI0033FD16D5